jgi:predicted nucleic acid-binding protein
MGEIGGTGDFLRFLAGWWDQRGVLGVLISAKQSGSLSSLRSEIETLRRDAGFFVDKALESRVLGMVGE